MSKDNRERFIKFYPSEKAQYLLINKPNAFILLTIIAMRANRNLEEYNGLKTNEAHVGDWEKYGMSRQNYRTALKFLISQKFLEISETNRTRKKSTTGITTTGTKVKLLDSSIFDINSESDNHQPNHCLTTDQPLPNHVQENKEDKKIRIKKEKIKKEKISEIEKINFRDFVTLTQVEYDSLLQRHGKQFLDSMLDVLNSYKGRTGKEYKSDYSAMDAGSWVVEQVSKGKLYETSHKPAINGDHSAGEPRFKAQRVLSIKRDS